MAKTPIPTSNFERELVSGSIKGAMKAAEATEKSGLWLVPVTAIRRLDGFNVRIATPDYEAHIESLAQSIFSNGFYPDKPLVGYIAKDGDDNVLFMTDGYSRLAGVEIANERGAEIEKLPVIVKPQTDNMIDLTVALIQGNEGRPLTVFERAIVVKRLIGYNLDRADIAKRLDITDRYVGDLEILAGAPSKVRNLVITGKIAPTEAIKQLRKDPVKAGDRLSAAVEKAAAEGKTKASAKHVEDAGDEDETPKHVSMTKKITKGRQVETLVYRLKGGEKVRKGSLESILAVDGGSWWREPEDLDDAKEGDVVITKTIEIGLTIKQEAPEMDSGDAPDDEDIDNALADDAEVEAEPAAEQPAAEDAAAGL